MKAEEVVLLTFTVQSYYGVYVFGAECDVLGHSFFYFMCVMLDNQYFVDMVLYRA